MLGFDCKISAGATVKFYQIERAVAMSGSVVPFNGDYRLINFRKLIRDYVVSMCFDKKGETNRADKFWNRYLYGIQKMKEILNIDMDNTSQIIMEDHPAKFYRKGTWPDWDLE